MEPGRRSDDFLAEKWFSYNTPFPPFSGCMINKNTFLPRKMLMDILSALQLRKREGKKKIGECGCVRPFFFCSTVKSKNASVDDNETPSHLSPPFVALSPKKDFFGIFMRHIFRWEEEWWWWTKASPRKKPNIVSPTAQKWFFHIKPAHFWPQGMYFLPHSTSEV